MPGKPPWTGRALSPEHREKIRAALKGRPFHGRGLTPEQRLVSKSNRNRARLYGITPARFDELMVAQGGCCAICRSEPSPTRRLSVDHDHATGSIRGLLCFRCNTRLGQYEELNATPEWVGAARDYLDR